MEEELYCFEGLKQFLHVQGINVKEPYMPVDPEDVSWYEGGQHIEFTDDGIYLIKRNGGKQKVFLYRNSFYDHKPPFHVFCCPKIERHYIGKIFHCGNTGTVPIVQNKMRSVPVSDLPICGYCAEMAGLDKTYNSTSYINLLRRGQSINNAHTNENLSVYSDNWQEVKDKYLEEVNFRCERCGIHIPERFDRDKYLVVHHINHVYNDDSPNNLRCLCLECLSEIDKKSVWINGANKQNLNEFLRIYRKKEYLFKKNERI